MATHSTIARMIARRLSATPGLKRTTKTIYQRLHYFLHRPASKITLADGWSMQKVGEEKDLTFFGYYDKSCWNAASTLIATHRRKGEACEICVASNDSPSELTVLAETKAWNWQQGAMLSWSPDNTLYFNTFENGKLITRRISAHGELVCDYDLPVQSISPDGATFMSLNYNRLRHYRAEYGYSKDGSNSEFAFDDEKDGIWSVDTQSGKIRLIVTLAQLKANLPRELIPTLTAHKVNHICWSPNGQKILFMHRYFQGGKKSSRLYAADPDGRAMILLADNQIVSHYTWLDNTRVVAWSRDRNGRDGYNIYDITTVSETRMYEGRFDQLGDGHPSLAGSSDWLAFDTYPLKDRCRRLFIVSEENGTQLEVARLFAAWENEGPTRCDLHPRWAPNAQAVSIDSDYTGQRSHYILRKPGGLTI